MRDVGVQVKVPRKSCDDALCPFHGNLQVRGRVLEGVVISDKMDGTVVVRRDYLHYVSKYMRYERRHSHIPAHNPPCVNVGVGNKVKIMECRPLSKSVSFVVIERMGEG